MEGPNSRWTNSNVLRVGNGGTGTLNILDGGMVSNTIGSLGSSPGSKGTATVSGADSLWMNSRTLYVGESGAAVLNIEDGGTVSATAGLVIAFRNSSTGTLNLNDDGVLRVGGNNGLSAGAGASAFHFAGGTLQVAGSDLTSSIDATLSGTTSTIDTNGFNATFSGVFSGSGGLTKSGTGTLRLPGDHTYTGDTSIEEGNLILNGSIASVETVVHSAGLLGGIGTIGGRLVNSGIVSPGDPVGTPGKLTVRGDFVQSSGGALHIDVGGRMPGEFDLLDIRGAAALKGAVRLNRLNGFQLEAGDRIVFLTASDGVTGTFAREENDFSTGTMVSGRVVYGADDAALEAVQESFEDVEDLIGKEFPGEKRELTPDESVVAKVLDSIVDDPRAEGLIAYLDGRSLPELPGDFDLIAPEELTAIFQISVSLANVQALNLQQRMSDLRNGASGFSAEGWSINGTESALDGKLKDDKESKAAFVPSPDNRWGIFVTGIGEWVNVDGNSNAAGYDITTAGFTLGVDYKVTPNFVVGVNAGYANSGADLANGGQLWVNGGKLGLYTTYFTGGFYVDAAVNGGYNSYDTKRVALQGDARGSTDGGDLNVLFGTGYDWRLGSLTMGPTATFQYTYVGLDGFTEHGSLAPLRYGYQDADSLRSAFGFKASYDWKLGKVFIRPGIRAAWQHEFGDDPYTFDSSFANGAGNTFTVAGPQISRDSALIGAGVSVQFNECLMAYLSYDGQLGNNYQSQTVSGGLRIGF